MGNTVAPGGGVTVRVGPGSGGRAARPWPGAASSVLVPRSRAMPAGSRWPVLPLGARCRAPSAQDGCTQFRPPSAGCADRRSAFQAVPALFRGWRWEFRGLWPRCRSGDRRSWPSPRFFAVGDGSFTAFGRDAGLETGAPASSWSAVRGRAALSRRRAGVNTGGSGIASVRGGGRARCSCRRSRRSSRGPIRRRCRWGGAREGSSPVRDRAVPRSPRARASPPGASGE